MGKILKRNLLAKITCLILSFALWMYIIQIENPVKRKTFNDVAVSIINIDALKNRGLALKPNQKPQVSVTVEGPASEILKLQKGDIMLTADLLDRNLRNGDNEVPITAKLPSGISLTGNVKENIALEALVEKQFTVKPGMKLKATDGFFAPLPAVNTIVMASGPKSVIETVASVIATDDLKDLSQSSDRLFKLVPVDKDGEEIKEGVIMDKSYAPIRVNVYPVKEVEVKEKTSGKLNEGLTLKSAKSNISKVKIAAPKAVLDTIKFIETEAVPLEKVSVSQNEIPVKLDAPKDVFILNNEATGLFEGTATVKVDVTPKETKQVTKEITISGKAQGATATLDNAKTVVITLSGDKTKLDALDANSISATVDVTNLPIGKNEVEVKVAAPADFAVTTVTPQKVMVIITQ